VWGVLAGGLFSVYALFLYTLQGGASLEQLGITLRDLIGLYVLGGLLVGILAGMMLPLTKRRSGAVLVGIVAALPFYFGVVVMLGQDDWYSGVISALLVGGGSGFVWWEPFADDSPGTTG
jgi:hypothetical protein